MRRRLECLRDRLFGTIHAQCEMTSPLFGVGHQVRQSPVDLLPTGWLEHRPRDSSPEWVGEPDTAVLELDDIRGDRGIEQLLAIPIRSTTDQLDRWAQQQRCDAERVPGARRQSTHPLTHHHLQHWWQWRIRFLRIHSGFIERPRELEREHRVAGGRGMDPFRGDAGYRAPAVGREEALHRLHVERAERHALRG